MIPVPPCIKKAVSARDKNALDEVFSFLRGFGDDETKNAILWSIGYYDFSNYNERRLTAEHQIKTAPFFVCTPIEKPLLGKYCSQGDEKKCPLRDPVTKFNLLIQEVRLEFYPKQSVANIEIKLRDGTVFARKNVIYHPINDSPFWEQTLAKFINWYMETHQGKFYDIVVPGIDELKKIIFAKLEVVVKDDAATLYQQDVIQF